MIDILTLKKDDVVYLHAPANPLQDRYQHEELYNTIGIVKYTPDKYAKYVRIQLDEIGCACLYHGGEITIIGEL